MRKPKILLFAIITLVVVLFLFWFFIDKADDESKVCFEDSCFNVEVVDSSEEREKGLMFRESLDKNKGMLFIFEQSGNYPFWMKNTLIPLDMIWIDEENRIVYIKDNAMPCKENTCEIINPNANAKYVVELNSGTANEIGINIGDEAIIKI